MARRDSAWCNPPAESRLRKARNPASSIACPKPRSLAGMLPALFHFRILQTFFRPRVLPKEWRPRQARRRRLRMRPPEKWFLEGESHETVRSVNTKER